MRILKQLIYASLFFFMLVVVGIPIYINYTYEEPTCFDNIKNQDEREVDCGGGCIDCAIIGAELVTTPVEFINAGEGQVTIITEVKNPIIRGAFFVYNVDIIGKFGGTLTSIDGATFVRRMNSRYIVLPGVNINPGDIKEGFIEISDIIWEPETKADTPVIETIGVKTVLSDGELKVTGNLRNLTDGIVNRIRITALLLGEDGVVVNASVAQVDSIKVLESVPFTIFFPAIDEELIKTINTRIFPEIVPTF